MWWNEGDFVTTYDALDGALSATQEISDISSPDPSLDDKLSHASGLADTQDVLMDPICQISEHCIFLHRDVRYYQCVEKRKRTKRKHEAGGEEAVTM